MSLATALIRAALSPVARFPLYTRPRSGAAGAGEARLSPDRTSNRSCLGALALGAHGSRWQAYTRFLICFSLLRVTLSKPPPRAGRAALFTRVSRRAFLVFHSALIAYMMVPMIVTITASGKPSVLKQCDGCRNVAPAILRVQVRGRWLWYCHVACMPRVRRVKRAAA